MTVDLIDRYLSAVQRNLPASVQDDVIAELRDDLESQIEDRESELGRELTPDEQSAILKSSGHPLLVASRYRAAQYLIGPTTFPFYLQTLKIVLGLVAALNLGLAIVDAELRGGRLGAGAAWGTFWGTLLAAFAVVTIVFAAIERAPKTATIDRWDPRSLPEPDSETSVPRSKTIPDLIFNLLAAIWLLDVPGARHLTMIWVTQAGLPQPFPLTAGDAWWSLLTACGIVSAGIVAVDIAMLIRPNWYRFRAAAMLLLNGGLAAVCVTLSQRTGPYVMPAAAAGIDPQIVKAAHVLSEMTHLGLMLGAAITAGSALWFGWVFLAPSLRRRSA